MREKGPRGDGESVWEISPDNIVEMSGMKCSSCGQGLVVGNAFSVDTRNNNPYHQGCANAATKNNPVARVFFKIRSWPRGK